MRPYCRAGIFLIAMAIKPYVQGEVVRAPPSLTTELWFEPHQRLWFLPFFFPFPLPFQFFFDEKDAHQI